MAYISGLSPVIKGEKKLIQFNKDQFLFATNFATNPHFADELNWARLAIHYVDALSQQRQIIILKDDNANGWFSPSEVCRTGTWSVDRIEVYDKQGDFFVVNRSNMPSPDNFNIAVNRIVAPASAVVSFIEGSNLIVGGDFTTLAPNWVLGTSASLAATAGKGVLSNNAVIGQGFSLLAEQDSVIETGARYRASMNVPAITVDQNIVFETSYQMGAYSTVYSGVGPQSNKNLQVYFNAANTSVTTRFGLINLAAGSAAIGARSVQVDDITLVKVPSEVNVAMGQGLLWKEGFKCKLWDTNANAFISSDVYTINSITAGHLGLYDKFTFDKQIQGDYAGKSLILRFPSYAECVGAQSAMYQFVGNTY